MLPSPTFVAESWDFVAGTLSLVALFDQDMDTTVTGPVGNWEIVADSVPVTPFSLTWLDSRRLDVVKTAIANPVVDLSLEITLASAGMRSFLEVNAPAQGPVVYL